jgi:probable addiction module antidote protein
LPDNSEKDLQDTQEAADHLRAALEHNDPRAFLVALREVVRAQGGVSQLARAAKISREHLYDLLSERGNPEFLTLTAILAALGYQFSIDPAAKNPPGH